MNGARDIKFKRINGSATVEAAVVLPFFLMFILSMVYIIRIFYTYNTVQNALAEVGRKIGNMSYFYHMTGMKDFSDQLSTMANEAGTALQEQQNTVINAFRSFNEAITGDSEETITVDDIGSLLNSADNITNNFSQVTDMVNLIVEDPKAELHMFMTIFANKLNYGITNNLVCLIAKGSLGTELKKRVKNGNGDAALALGIKDGLEGISFENSSIFGDSESLELVVEYKIKAPVPFGLIPELKLSNRVKIIAWTGGRGKTVKVKEIKAEEENESASIWTQMDSDKRYCDRGLEIEKLHVAKIKNKNGITATPTSSDYPVIDAYILDYREKTIELYDIFTLNPFMKTYTERPSAIKSEIKKHGKRLLEVETPDFIDTGKFKTINRIVIVVFPDNAESYAEEAYENARKELAQYNVEVRLVKGYGSYEKPEEKVLDEAAA
ncbi:MAG: TadE family protein [Acetivibrionales bacterium]